jgi:hypothetical protein
MAHLVPRALFRARLADTCQNMRRQRGEPAVARSERCDQATQVRTVSIQSYAIEHCSDVLFGETGSGTALTLLCAVLCDRDQSLKFFGHVSDPVCYCS